MGAPPLRRTRPDAAGADPVPSCWTFVVNRATMEVGQSYEREANPMTVTVAVTGATGSFGRAFIPHLLDNTDHSVLGISRNELLQERCRHDWVHYGDRVHLTPCDVTDTAHLTRLFVFNQVHAVVHAAALKRVPNSYHHATEYVRVNVEGTRSLLRACRLTKPGERVVLISTDKAVDAHNVYGATKRVAEGLTLEEGGVVVRGGNVWGSDGSVVKSWLAQVRAGGPITVYDPGATRFHLPMGDWCEFVLTRLEHYEPGLTFVPKLGAYHVGELAHAFMAEAHNIKGTTLLMDPKVHMQVTGPRRGDKRHEVLVSPAETLFTADRGDHYAVYPDPVNGAEYDVRGVSSKYAPVLGPDRLRAMVREVIGWH